MKKKKLTLIPIDEMKRQLGALLAVPKAKIVKPKTTKRGAKRR